MAADAGVMTDVKIAIVSKRKLYEWMEISSKFRS